MSLRYRDKNGAERVVSGLTPGGDIEYGAVATRNGNFSFESIDIPANDGYVWQQVTFSEPMPDDDYEVTWHFNTSGESVTFSVVNVTNKTQDGFKIWIRNSSVDRVIGPHTLYWKAFKLYTVADAEALYSKVLDMETMIPSSASSTNKFATADDLRTETRTLDRRLDDVEDVIPSSASITNKLATAADVEEAMENAGLPVCSEVPSSPADKDVMLYIGEETGFTKGGIYQYTADPGAWVLISTADVDLSKYETSWTGTKAEWDALSADEKKQYKIANITDDVIGGEVADVVQDGLMSPVTSNAVYDALGNKQDKLTGTNYSFVSQNVNFSDYTLRKTGNIVVFSFNMNINPSAIDWITCGTLPTAVRPSSAVYGAGVDAWSHPFIIHITSAGLIQIYPSTTGSTSYCYCNLTWII